MKKIALLIIIVLSLYGVNKNPELISSFLEQQPASTSNSTNRSTNPSTNNQLLSQAFKNRKSDIQVAGEGIVVRNLRDDTKGSQHQKFILKLDSGQKILIAHNIDLAPRINSLSKGDSVQFYGEYEWNAKGGVIHWTHHDPQGRHIDGWLKHNGSTYQ